MLYLVKGCVWKTEYEQDGSTSKDVLRLVEADSAEESETKFVKHFDSKTDQYSVYYRTYVAEVSEVIS